MSRNLDEIWTKERAVLVLGTYTFDIEHRELRDADGRPIALRRQSADVLTELSRRPEQTVEKDELIKAVWNGIAVTDDSLVQCIADIRRTLGGDAKACIQTVPRRGYRLVPTKAAPDRKTRFRKNSMVAGRLVLTALAVILTVLFIPRKAPDTVHQQPVFSRPTIAVLPFANLGSDPDRLYFSDGLTEDLTTDLSRFSGLRIISSASSFTYRDTQLSPDAIARELNATHLITGSVRRDGRRVRINATLTDAATGANIWADRYDRDIGRIFDFQDDVTSAIVTALSLELPSGEQLRFEQQQQIDPDAYDLLLRGLAPLRRFTDEGIAEARNYFNRAIEIDPNYARAYANLALTYGQAAVFRLGSDAVSTPVALRAAERAQELDPTIPQTQFALAVVNLSLRHHDAAIEASRRAIALDPNYADGYAVLAQTLAYSGDLDDALAAIQTAKILNPRFSFAYLWVEAHILFQIRSYEKAREILEEVIERNPAFLVGRQTLAATYGYLGMLEEAEWQANEILTISPDVSTQLEGEAAPYRKSKDRAHLVTGLLLAGLPE